MKHCNYKMVCIDVDGTLVNDDKFISEITKRELIRVYSNYKIYFILVSSRMPKSLYIIIKELGITELFICYNGALVIDGKLEFGERKFLFESSIDINDAKKIINYTSTFDCHLGLYHFDDWIVNKIDKWALMEIKGTKVTPIVSNLENTLAQWKKEGTAPHKIMIRGLSENLNKIEPFLNINFKNIITFERIRDTTFEITPINVSKATGIEIVSTLLNIKKNEIMGIGDNINDLEMLRYVGYGIAMANSPQILKNVAKEITSSNNKDGIAKALLKHFP
ncbi:MAG: HAD family hydrolase [Bacteroidota bacterium]|nr:HAD family hydrolase [Bacteroidota bacterium]